MTLNRHQRRALMRGRLALLRGGRGDEALPRPPDRSTPQARLYSSLDEFTKSQLAREPELTATDVVAIYLRYAALFASKLTESDATGFARAAEELFLSELADKPNPTG